VVILTSSKEEGDRALSFDSALTASIKTGLFRWITDVVKKIGIWFTLNISAPGV
jgi:uncharacterized protein YbcV (DUF1398 family)